jgi:Mor family transcriptional regulator
MPDVSGPERFDDLGILRAIVGDESIYRRILEAFSGAQVYFPKIDRNTRDERILQTYIKLRFHEGNSSTNAAMLIARKEKLSVKQIRRIIIRSGIINK